MRHSPPVAPPEKPSSDTAPRVAVNPPSGKAKVHGAGDRRLDAVLDFLGFAARPMPLVRLLDEAPQRIARIFDAKVASLYVVEGDGNELVMRGNVGFARSALGQVRLAVGEGLTGSAVEYLRPVSCEDARAHTKYRRFDVLDEDRYPAFLAVPIRGKTGALGALVVQRDAPPFGPADVELLASLGGVIAAGIRHAELLEARRESVARRAGGGTRKITLTGEPAAHGRALGAIAAARRPAAHPEGAPSMAPEESLRRLRGAFDVAQKSVRALTDRARSRGLASAEASLATCTQILEDARLRERTEEIAVQEGAAQALARVVREATRTAALSGDPFLEGRVRDVEDLCDALTMFAATDKRAELPSRAVLLSDRLSVFDLLVSARSQPVAVVLTERVGDDRARELVELFGIPTVAGVKNLFRWASDGDLALVDADHGLVVVNPSKGEVASLRAHLRRGDA